MADLDTGPNSYIRIPPDSTGKRLFTDILLAIDYKAGTSNFIIGDEITSGSFIGIVSGLRPGNTTANGTIYVTVSVSSDIQTVTVNSDLNVDAIKFAEVEASAPINIPGQIIRGANNPLNGLNVDDRGSAFVRFTDGSQQLGAFGASKVASSEQLASYTFYYGIDPTEWSHEVLGTGSSISHLDMESSLALDVDVSDGDSAISTTDRYHTYQPGFGQLVEMTVACGDSGKAGVRRRWGYFDDNNGLFFEQNGTDLYVVQRSNTTGVVVDTMVDRLNWNKDKLDGEINEENPSGMLLDLTNLNVYWIDFAWLGAGRVRFGVFSEIGERIVIHTVHNPNSLNRPYMASGTLPIRVSIENIAPTVSPSRIKLTCAQVEVEGKIVPTLERASTKWTIEGENNVNSESHIASWRPSLELNGIRNSKTTVPESIRCYVKNQPCRIKMYYFSTITGGTWNQIGPDVAGEANLNATFVDGYLLYDWYLDVGSHVLQMPLNFNLLGMAGRLNANNSRDAFTFTAESLEPTSGDSNILFSFTGIDI